MLLKYIDSGDLCIDKIVSVYTCVDLSNGYFGYDTIVPGVIFKCADDSYVYVVTGSAQEAEGLVDDIFARGKLSVKDLPAALVYEDDTNEEIGDKLDSAIGSKKNISKELRCF